MNLEFQLMQKQQDMLEFDKINLERKLTEMQEKQDEEYERSKKEIE